MITADNPTVARYINRIRNPAKKTYAKMLWIRLELGRPTDDLPSFGLGVMAREAVRMNLEMRRRLAGRA